MIAAAAGVHPFDGRGTLRMEPGSPSSKAAASLLTSPALRSATARLNTSQTAAIGWTRLVGLPRLSRALSLRYQDAGVPGNAGHPGSDGVT
jgi:hypothetical protein